MKPEDRDPFAKVTDELAFHVERVGPVYQVQRTTETGIHTGRIRWSVFCQGCNHYVHEATTGPASVIDAHDREWHR